MKRATAGGTLFGSLHLASCPEPMVWCCRPVLPVTVFVLYKAISQPGGGRSPSLNQHQPCHSMSAHILHPPPVVPPWKCLCFSRSRRHKSAAHRPTDSRPDHRSAQCPMPCYLRRRWSPSQVIYSRRDKTRRGDTAVC